MATARHLPPNKSAHETADRGARWPVLARIAELRRDDETPPRATAGNEPNYRLDAPHLDTPTPPVAEHPLQAKLAASPVQRSGDQPRSQTVAPSQSSSTPDQPRASRPSPPVRTSVHKHSAQPHHELIRFAAMLALMVAAGMAAVFVMRDQLQSDPDTSNPVAATKNQSGDAEPAAQHAELEPALELQLTPQTDTSSLEPTATGPLSPAERPVMAVESEPLPNALPYPSTSLAEVELPPLDDAELPKVQTRDPEIARLRGDVIKTTIR